MNGNRISAILIILLVLSGALFVPFRAFAGAFPPLGSPASAVTANVGSTVVTSPPFNNSLSFPYPRGGPGYSFYAYVDVINVTSLGAFDIGFKWNQTFLQVKNITDGGFLTSVQGSSATGLTPFVINNTIGEVDAIADALETPWLAPTGSGHLLKVGFEVNPALSFRGGPVTLMHFNTSSSSPYQLEIDTNSSVDVTPPPQHVYDGAFTLGLPLSVTISPGSVTLDVFQSSLFTSTISGGTSPFHYQWYLNGAAVSGATGSTWNYTWSISGSFNVHVNVTDSSGFRAKSNIASVIVHPALLVGISPTLATCYVKQSQTFVSTVSGGTSPYSYQWYLNGSSVSGVNSISWTFKPNSTGVYTIYVKVTDAVKAVGQSGNAQLTVYPTPVIEVTIGQSEYVIEVGQSVTFNSSVAGGKSPYKYQWYLNGGAVAGANYSTWTFVPSFAGTYSIYLKVTDSLGTVGESNNATLIVNPAPSALVTPASVTLDVGEPWTFIASTSGGIPPFTYQWYLDGSPVINATGATWTFMTFVLANRTVYVTATDSIGIECVSNEVSVNISSAMNPLVSPSSAIMDAGQSQSYVATVSGGTGPYSYQWYQWFPSGSKPFSGATHAAFTFASLSSSIGVNIIYVEIEDSLGVKVDCGAMAIVNPPPAAFVSPASVIMDAGQSRQLSSTAVNGTPPYTYQWFIDGAPVVGAISNTWTYTSMMQSVGVHTVYLVVTDSLNFAVNSSNATIIVNPSPTILVTPASVTLDVGEPWTFAASTFNGTPPFSAYQWYLDSSPVVGATNSSWTYEPLVLVNRTVYVTASDSVGFECMSNKAQVTVSAAMNAKVSPSSAIMDAGQSQSYVATVSGGTGPYSYQWYQWFPSGSKPFSGATHAAFTFSALSSSIGFNIIYVEIKDAQGLKVDLGATANVNPTLVTSILPQSRVIDIGQSQLFTSTTVNGTKPYTYQWYIDNMPVAGANSNSWTYSPTLTSAGVHLVYLIVKDAVNFVAHSNNATITVNPPLTAEITPKHSVTDLGQSVLLTSIIAGGMVPYSLQWYVNGTLTGTGGVTLTIKPSFAGTYLVLLVATDAFGFTASNGSSVTINPVPTVTISPTSVSIPQGQNQTFTATVMYGTSPFSYVWYINSVLTARTTVPTFTFTPPSITTYYKLFVTITDAAGINATSNTAIINGHDVAVTEVVPVDNLYHGALKTVFDWGYPIAANVTVADLGYYNETFTVTAYVNTTVISSQTVALLSGGKTLITLAGITPKLAYGNYTISANIPPVPGEVNTANNFLANTTTKITVTIPGDTNGDGKVNIFDLMAIAFNWNRLVPPAPANADICGDGRIDIFDLMAVAYHWNTHV
jgi:hypothetical protein